MRLALFDLDNTLLAGDSDHAWGDWLCERGILDGELYKARNDAFYQDYLAGRLDIADYLNFTLEILGRTEMALLEEWHGEFMRERIEPIILAKGRALIERHHAQGDKVVIITATNRFVTGPIARHLGVDTLLATECEMAANLALEYPHVEFVKSCNMFCQHMRRITLEKILHSLENEVFEITVDPAIAARARQAIDRMLAVPRG